ncbi:MAG: hypothetical protein U9O78_00540 [Patescibacteria group bacterium]|nr:hypothetical protein [Patescibacteria group bacterium]
MEENSQLREKMPRRSFLKLMALVAGAFLGRHLLDDNILAALCAAESRVSKTIFKLPNIEHEIGEGALLKTWEKHFNSHASNFMSFEAWKRLASSFGNIINIHFNAQQEFDNYDDFFEFYIDKISQHCSNAELDLDIFFISMEYSGRQIIDDPETYRNDIVISAAQNIGGALADHYDVSSEFSDLVGVKTLGLDVKLGGQLPLNYAGALRMLSANVTTGIMDYELSEKSKQVVSQLGLTELRSFVKKYPELAQAYLNLERKRSRLDESRNKFEQHLYDFIPLLSDILDLFFSEDTLSNQAFNEIGLGDDPSSWQKVQPTKLWSHLFYHRKHNLTPEIIKEKRDQVIAEFVNLYKNDQQAAYQALLKDQIFNPLFINFLKTHGLSPQLADVIQSYLAEINTDKDAYKQALYEVQQKEAPLEFDIDYQLQIAALLTKSHLQLAEDFFGDFKKNSKDEVMFYAFIMSFIREASGANDLLNSKFGFDFTFDAPYARTEVLKSLEHYIFALSQDVGNPKENITLLQTKNLETISAPENLVNASRFWNWDSTVNWGNGVYLRGKTQFEE